jgi:DNA-binding NarL/FixJ family response regulator
MLKELSGSGRPKASQRSISGLSSVPSIAVFSKPMSEPIQILLAEDHSIVRQGLRAILSASSQLVVIGETGDGTEVVDLVSQLDPDVLLLDIMLPGLNGLEIVQHMTEKKSRCRVLILSMHTEESFVLKALRSGAAGYALKSADLEDLQHAIRTVARGHRYLSASLCDRAVDAYIKSEEETGGRADPFEQLTNREREVLRFMAEGYGNIQIGHHLGISHRTAEIHRANVMRKLGLSSQTAVVRYAIQRGLINLAR